jgi:hypothetical protein
MGDRNFCWRRLWHGVVLRGKLALIHDTMTLMTPKKKGFDQLL